MRIGINVFGLQATAGGVGNHVINLLRIWPLYFPEDEIILFCQVDVPGVCSGLEERKGLCIEYLETQEKVGEQLNRLDVYFCPAGVLWPRPLMVPCVLGMADIQERFYPENFSDEDLKYRLFQYDWSAFFADRIITVSDFSKRSIVRLMKIDEGKVDRIYHCPDELPLECERPIALPLAGYDNFVFYPGNNWKHKNHARLLDALKIAKQKGTRIPLVLTGANLEDGYAILENAKAFGLSDQVCHLGRVSRAEISWLYRNARLLAFVSEFEGFGIPIIEARSVGLPVLRGSHTSLSEVGSKSDFVCDVSSPESIATSLLDFWDAGRDEMKKGNQTLEEHFSEKTFVESHRKTFLKAISGFRPWRTAWKDRIRKRYSNVQRASLSEWERSEAAKLLQEVSSA